MQLQDQSVFVFFNAGDDVYEKVDFCYKHAAGGVVVVVVRGGYHTLNCYHVHVTRRRLLKRVNGQKADVNPLGGGGGG